MTRIEVALPGKKKWACAKGCPGQPEQDHFLAWISELCSLTGLEPDLYHDAVFSSTCTHSGYLPLAGVAQLVEQRFRKPQVVRSIRIAGSISSA